MSLPVRIKFDELPKHCLPRSSTARFSEKWQKSMGDEGFLEQVVDRWRLSGLGSGGDMSQQLAMMADAVGISGNSDADEIGEPSFEVAPPRQVPLAAATQNYPSQAGHPRPSAPLLRKDAPAAPQSGYPSRLNASATAPASLERRPQASAAIPEAGAAPQAAASLRSLRDRLMRPAGQ